MQRYTIYALILTLVCTSCYKDVDNTSKQTTTDPVPTLVNTKLSGSVEDQNGDLIEDYELQWWAGSHEVTGRYFITDLTKVDKAGQTVFVKKNSQILGLAQIPVFENDINSIHTTIHTSPPSLVLTDTQSLTEGVTATAITQGTQAEIKTLSIDGQALRTAYTADGELLVVTSASVWQVDLPSDSSIKLTQSSGVTLLAYDESTGRWTVTGDGSEARMTASGYFAAAQTTPGVLIQGQVLRDVQPVAYQWYAYEHNQGRSTAKGNWIQVLPSDSDIAVSLLNPCQENITTVSVSTSSIPANVNLTVGPNAIYQPIETTIIDCAGEPTADAIIQIVEANGTETLYLYADPDVSTSVLLCSDQFEISAYDIAAQESGLSIPWLTNIEDDITFLSTCADYADGYAYFSIDGNVKVYPAFQVEKTGTDIILSDAEDRIKLLLRGDSKGAYNVTDVNVNIYDPAYAEGLGYAVSCENSPLGCGISDLYVSHLDAADGWVRVTFSGNIWMQTLNPLKAGTYEVEGIVLSKI